MTIASPRIRCLLCDSLVERNFSVSAPFSIKTLAINGKRGCICSDCVESLYSSYNFTLKNMLNLSKRATFQEISPISPLFTDTQPTTNPEASNNHNSSVPPLNPPFIYPTNEMIMYSIKQLFPIPVSIVPTVKVSSKPHSKDTHNKNSQTAQNEVSIKQKYACLEYSMDSYHSLVTSKVFGQSKAAEMLIYTIYQNQLANMLEECEITQEEITKSHILLIGNTGVGKSFLVKNVAKTLKLPYALCNATSTTSAGYIGGKVEEYLEKLYENSGYNLELAQNGVLFIDEIDKKRINEDKTGRDVNGRAVQEELLKVLEPNIISVKKYDIDFDTSNLTVVMAGAFVGLDEVIDRRLNKKVIGFKSLDESTTEKRVLQEDIIEYGLIPEFIGRIPAIIPMNKLTKSVATDIIYSELSKKNIMFKVKNFDLIIDEFYIDFLAEEIVNSPIGARDVHSKIFNILEPPLFRILQCSEGGVCKIDSTGHIEVIANDSNNSLRLYEYDAPYMNKDTNT